MSLQHTILQYLVSTVYSQFILYSYYFLAYLVRCTIVLLWYHGSPYISHMQCACMVAECVVTLCSSSALIKLRA